MPIIKPTLNAEIEFSLDKEQNPIVVRQKFQKIEPLKLPPPILPYDQSYSRSLNISTGVYQKHPTNSKQKQNENSFIDNDPNLFFTNSFGNRKINSPKLVRRNDLVQDYKNSSPEVGSNSEQNNSISPICAKCLGKNNKKSSCVVS